VQIIAILNQADDSVWAAIMFDRQNVTAYRSKLVRKLEELGLKVTLESAAT
jgi:hypothetical protein